MYLIFAVLLMIIEATLVVALMTFFSIFDENVPTNRAFVMGVNSSIFIAVVRVLFLNMPMVGLVLYFLRERVFFEGAIHWKFGFINAICFIAVFIVYASFNPHDWRFLAISKPYYSNYIPFLILSTLVSPLVLGSAMRKWSWVF